MTRDTFKAKGNHMPSNEQREAIGDEKVVITAAKFAASTGRLPDQDDLERCNCELAGGIMHSQCGWDASRDMPAFIPGQSAYAELAADRDLWRSMATFEGKVSASVLEDLHTTQAQLAEERELRMSLESSWQQAEAQLAELRGKLEERCVMLDRLAGVIRKYGLCAPMALEEVAKQIRALAVADGG